MHCHIAVGWSPQLPTGCWIEFSDPLYTASSQSSQNCLSVLITYMALPFLRLREREAGGIGRGRKAGRKEIKEEEGDWRRGGRDRAQDEKFML